MDSYIRSVTEQGDVTLQRSSSDDAYNWRNGDSTINHADRIAYLDAHERSEHLSRFVGIN